MAIGEENERWETDYDDSQEHPDEMIARWMENQNKKDKAAKKIMKKIRKG